MLEEAGPPSLVLGALGRIADVERGRLEDVLATITETAARTLDVARVNVWLYDEERHAIQCVEGYERAGNRHERGAILRAADYPHYFSALDRLRNVTALDVASDPRTEELLETYLVPHGIGSMLDVPILRSGQVVGVVCHEHVGPPRSFATWERYFAGSIGDLVALALETERRVTAERERTKLAARLGQARQLESLGMLAAGVAHDLRNLLMVVTGSVDLLARDDSEATRGARADILEAVNRSKELCELLLSYSGHSSVTRSRVPLGPLVVETERLLRGRMPAHTSVTLDIAQDAPDVAGEATSLRQIVLNLLLNAFDAVAERGGQIAVRLRPAETPADLALDFRSGPGPCLLLEVEDDGAGMSTETRDKIFDPFFTTKSKGHGVGLASVLGIVRSHGGALEVESELGRGSVLRVWLPIAGSG